MDNIEKQMDSIEKKQMDSIEKMINDNEKLIRSMSSYVANLTLLNRLQEAGLITLEDEVEWGTKLSKESKKEMEDKND